MPNPKKQNYSIPYRNIDIEMKILSLRVMFRLRLETFNCDQIERNGNG
ncbi:hypothetical protein [Pararhodonellum marinum]|nr:hypothetical protein [Pararhodonellum marinum]